MPVFGCGAVAECTEALTEKHPLLDPDRIGAWLAKGLVDQLSLDSGHLATEYATWRIDAATAQRNQWIQVRARAWDAYAHIAAEDTGFAAPGGSRLTTEQATQTITDRIAAPLQDAAARHHHPLDPLAGRPGPGQPRVRREVGGQPHLGPAQEAHLHPPPRLATLYDPATPEVDVATDLRNLSEVFGQLYIRTV
ncbi:hypothetical protein ACFSTC_02360 [Nonomuraea ferruginea]